MVHQVADNIYPNPQSQQYLPSMQRPINQVLPNVKPRTERQLTLSKVIVSLAIGIFAAAATSIISTPFIGLFVGCFLITVLLSGKSSNSKWHSATHRYTSASDYSPPYINNNHVTNIPRQRKAASTTNTFVQSGVTHSGPYVQAGGRATSWLGNNNSNDRTAY